MKSTPAPFCYRMDISYDGSSYAGWQIQPNAITIQETIESALAIVLKSHHRIIGSGRTDAGVHALQQTAHFTTEASIDCLKTLRACNGILPHDIRITLICPIHPKFHAQKSALTKEYHYTIISGPFSLPFDQKYSWHLFQEIDLNLLQKACHLFEGTHDFKAYANENHTGSAAKNSIRTIYSIRVIEEPYIAGSRKIRLEFHGNGFLYKMVRNITGMVIAVATKKRPIEEIAQTFTMKDRKAVDRAAPAHGLKLIQATYPDWVHTL